MAPKGASALLHLHDPSERHAACLGEGTAELIIAVGFYAGQCTVQLGNGHRPLRCATDARTGLDEQKEELSAGGDHHRRVQQLLYPVFCAPFLWGKYQNLSIEPGRSDCPVYVYPVRDQSAGSNQTALQRSIGSKSSARYQPVVDFALLFAHPNGHHVRSP